MAGLTTPLTSTGPEGTQMLSRGECRSAGYGWNFTQAGLPAPQVQCFDPKEEQWRLCSPAPFSQRCLEAVSLEDTIYVVGGLMSKVFTYHPRTDIWGEAAVLPHPMVS